MDVKDTSGIAKTDTLQLNQKVNEETRMLKRLLKQKTLKLQVKVSPLPIRVTPH